MWKEWTNKIKTFAEDITSPDYDEERRRAGSGSAGDLGQETEDEDALHDAQDHSTGVRPAAGYGGNRGIVTSPSNNGSGPGGANTRGLPVLETPVRRLDSQYDDMPLERWTSSRSVESVPYAQPAPPAPAPSAAADASHSAGDRDESFDSVSLRQQHQQLQPAAAAASPSVSSHALPPAHGASAAERRGPPQAMVTPRPAPATAQPAPASASASAPVDSIHAKRVAALEAEKAQLMRDINAYQAEVRVAHEQTVAYYEAKLREAAASSSASVTAAERASTAAAAAEEEEEESKQEIVALRAALQSAATELQTAQTAKQHFEMRVCELETQTELLQSSLAAAQAKVEAAASAPLPAPDADAVQQQEQLRRQMEEAQEVQAHLQQEVEEKAAQLAAAEQARCSLEAQLREAQAELKESLSSACERSAAAAAQTEELQQLHDDVDRLTGELHAERQRTTTVEAQRVAAEQETQTLATQLVEEKHKVAQAAASVEALKTSQAAAAAPPAPRVDPSAQERLLDKLNHAEAERDVLQQEVRRRTEAAAQLQRTMETQEREHQAALALAHRELAEREAALRAKLTDAEARREESRGALEVEVRELHAQLEVTQKQVQAMTADKAAVQAEAASAEQRCRAAQAAAAALQQQLQQQAQQAADAASERARQLECEERQRASEAERRRTGAEVSVAALTQVKKELEHKLQTLETTAEQLRSMTVDTLVRLGVDLKQVVQDSQRHGGAGAAASAATAPSAAAHHGGRRRGRGDHDEDGEDAPSSDEEAGEDEEEASADSRSSINGGDDTSADRYRDVPLVQLFSLLVAECVQQHSIVVRAERVQREWEQTYEQARHVNEALNQQLADAWATIGKLREAVSVREETARLMQSRVGSGDARLVEVQEQLTSALHEVQTLREERASWVSRLQLAQSGAEGQAQAMAALEEELQALQALLQAKEEELQTSMQSAENLQLVLDRFQENKRNEVEALTLESQLETEEMKKQLEATRRTTERHASELAAVREGFERQLAMRDAEVTTMHRKLAEVRKALEKTASRHMDGGETSIDKRVVSQLLAKYIHAFIGQRKEAEDMLKVMSGLLDWDEATQELAGLLPGPNNPQPPGGAGAGAGGGGQRRGLFGWRRGNTQPTDRAPSIVAGSGPAPAASSSSSTSGGGAGAPPGKSGLASMWVEFLMKESEGRAGSAEAAPASPLASSSTSTPAGTEQRATRSVGCSSPPAQPPTSNGGPAA